MQAYYRSVLGQDGPASPEERRALRHAMIDYGALQPSPVQKPADSRDMVVSSRSPSQQHNDVRLELPSDRALLTCHQRKPMIANLTNPPVTSPLPATAPTPNSYTSNFSWNTPPAVPPLEADETFNLDSFDQFSLTNEELEAMMINATQEFWASFPGEVGVGYQ
jgi:hypothetical protein